MNKYGLTEEDIIRNRAFMESLPKIADEKKPPSNEYTRCCEFLRKRKAIRTKQMNHLSDNPRYILQKMVRRGKAKKTGWGQWEWAG